MTLSPERRAVRRRSALLAAVTAGFAALMVALYWPGLHGPLVLDDLPNLAQLMDPSQLSREDWLSHLISGSGPLGRPVAMATFLLNGLVSPNDIWVWKLTNVLVHALNALLVFWLSAHLWCFRKPSVDSPCWWAGLLIAAFWALHPLQVSTVLYLVQRMAQLSTLFTLAGLLVYVIWRKRSLAGRSASPGLALAFLLCAPLAALSKENGALLPFLIVILEAVLFRFRGSATVRRELFWWLGIFALLPALAVVVALSTNFDSLILAGYERRSFDITQRVLTELRVLVEYLSWIVLPVQERLGFFHDDIIPSTSWLEPRTTLLSGLFLLGLFIVSILLRRKVPLASLGILFFLVGHSLESTIYPLVLVFEHRNYLPSLGIIVALAALASKLPVQRAPARLLMAGALGLCIILTVLRVQTWASPEAFYRHAVMTHPQSSWARSGAAEWLRGQGDYARAYALLEDVEGPGPALQRLHLLCQSRGALPPHALEGVRSQLEPVVDNYTVSGLLELSKLQMDSACDLDLDELLAMVATVRQLRITDSTLRFRLAVYHAQLLWQYESFQRAIQVLDDAQKIAPQVPLPSLLAADWMVARGELARAREHYRQALDIAARSSTDWQHLISKVGSGISALAARREGEEER